MSEATGERIWCMQCGKSVSSEVPKGTVVRAWIECPECLEKGYADAQRIVSEWLDDRFHEHDKPGAKIRDDLVRRIEAVVHEARQKMLDTVAEADTRKKDQGLRTMENRLNAITENTPCWRCGQTPKEDEVWRVEIIAGEERLGHAKCFEKDITDTRIGKGRL